MFAGKKSAQIREILISESAWEEMTCLFAPSVGGVDTGVPIYAIKKEGHYTLYRAGSVFNWRWVGSGAFTSLSSCPKI
ncbi:phage exclusion lipoprotein Cor [Enterobacter roggenkampii]|uniref:phage exclusion lipoprotein Cor n=2 Tax=Enterobacter roggenkampii TaxID=1812935 RepID=UPI001F0B30D8|nr:hypothetical protein [Enterobacter roggenkampii]